MTEFDDELIETAAKAAFKAMVPAEGVTFADVAERSREVFRTQARAVLAAIGLREERRMNAMSSGGMTTDTRTGVTTAHSDMRYDHRWVTDWKPLTAAVEGNHP